MSYIEDLEREITATANVAERQRERAKAAEAQVADLRARLEASERGLRALEDSEKHLDGVFNEERAKLDASERAALDVARAERDLLQHVACAAAFDCGRSAAETDRVEVSLTKWIRDSYFNAGWNEAIEAAALAAYGPFCGCDQRIRALRKPDNGGDASDATHRCKVCGALWRLNPPTYPQHCGPKGCSGCRDSSWSMITPNIMGKCCDNVAMGEQIEPLEAK